MTLQAIRDELDLLLTAVQASREQKHHLVVVPDAGDAYCKTFDTEEELVAFLRNQHGQDIQVFAFSGTRLAISKSPRYLITPTGRYPLFTQTNELDVDDTGSLADGPPVNRQINGQPPSEDEDEPEEDEELPEDDEEPGS